MRHWDIKIFGRVHGVNFRWSTKQKAKGLHLCGFVCNKPDGSVYVEAEGQTEDIEEFLDWCRRGPLFAKVRQIMVEEGQIRGYNDFEIKYN
ncbi:MAG TPA: acylphosphatase [Patescibacteria group bacterium]